MVDRPWRERGFARRLRLARRQRRQRIGILTANAGSRPRMVWSCLALGEDDKIFFGFTLEPGLAEKEKTMCS